MSRRLTDLLRYAARLGYVDEGTTKGGHRRLWHRRTGRHVVVPSTPGYGRSVANSRALLRRVARAT